MAEHKWVSLGVNFTLLVRSDDSTPFYNDAFWAYLVRIFQHTTTKHIKNEKPPPPPQKKKKV